MNATFSWSQLIDRVTLSLLSFQYCFEQNFTTVRQFCNPAMIKQIFTFETGPNSLFSSSIAQSKTLDEFRKESYIINLHMLWAFSNVSRQLQLKFSQVQTSYQLIEKLIVFTPTKTMHATYNRSKFTITSGNKIWLDTGFDRTGKLIGI